MGAVLSCHTAGTGGCCRLPSGRRWMRSSCALTPSQKKAVSRDDAGRIMVAGSRSSGTGDAAASDSRGLNLRMRQFISATSSSPTRQMMCWLMNQPSPSAVCLGPITSPISEVMLTCSPGRR